MQASRWGSPSVDAARRKPAAVGKRVLWRAIDATFKLKTILLSLNGTSLKLQTALLLFEENLARSGAISLEGLQFPAGSPAHVDDVALALNRLDPALDHAFMLLQPAVTQAPVAFGIDKCAGGSANACSPAKPERGAAFCYDRRASAGCCSNGRHSPGIRR